jgi:RNA polymerase sigma factor (sigma-70 family)
VSTGLAAEPARAKRGTFVSSEPLSNLDLVRHLVRAGPEDPAWLDFISRYHQRIRCIAHRAFLNEAQRNYGLDTGKAGDVVEDLTQDVFVRLIDGNRRALSHFHGRSESSLYMYLHAIATNLVRDHFRKFRAQRKIPAAASLSEPLRTADGALEAVTLGDCVASPSPGPDAAAEASELRARIAKAVDRVSGGSFSNRDRLVFRLFFVEGLTYDEIASLRAIGLSTAGVEKCIRRIRKALQRILADQKKKGRQEPADLVYEEYTGKSGS